MSLLDELLTSAVKNSYEKNKRKESEPSILGALKDPQFLQDMKRGVFDSVNRGAVASTIGGPVDLATMALRPLGYNVEKPVLGSEWVGDKMQQLGLLGDTRNPIAEAIASVAVPGAMSKVAPKVFQAEQAAIKNAQMPSPMNGAMRGQFGGVKVGEKFQYPQEKALLTAQKNAALPVEQGGLGLHPNNTPAERAKALGFTDDVYHGSPNPDIQAFDTSLAGKNTGNAFENYVFSTNEPANASGYSLNWQSFKKTLADSPEYQAAEKRKTDLMAQIPDAFKEGGKDAVAPLRAQLNEESKLHHQMYDKFLNNEIPSEGSTLYPLKARSDDFYPTNAEGGLWRDVNQRAIDSSKYWNYDGVRIQNVRDNAGSYGGLSDVYATSNPANIRSRFAAFDPLRKHENDLLAGAMPFGLLLDPEMLDKFGR